MRSLADCLFFGQISVSVSATDLFIRRREFDLPVDTAGSEQSGVQNVNPVSGHDDLMIDRLIFTLTNVQNDKRPYRI